MDLYRTAHRGTVFHRRSRPERRRRYSPARVKLTARDEERRCIMKQLSAVLAYAPSQSLTNPSTGRRFNAALRHHRSENRVKCHRPNPEHSSSLLNNAANAQRAFRRIARYFYHLIRYNCYIARYT